MTDSNRACYTQLHNMPSSWLDNYSPSDGKLSSVSYFKKAGNLSICSSSLWREHQGRSTTVLVHTVLKAHIIVKWLHNVHISVFLLLYSIILHIIIRNRKKGPNPVTWCFHACQSFRHPVICKKKIYIWICIYIGNGYCNLSCCNIQISRQSAYENGLSLLMTYSWGVSMNSESGNVDAWDGLNWQVT